ncbi:MAG: hypothetical protein B6D77_11245 [gamma proteobacterium symbiont of Ctena orbiculata]|nr:MAG: hypothetical protein B6D77_11245 [gamma proteobacterium symbiont of Ctena orbiculata]
MHLATVIGTLNKYIVLREQEIGAIRHTHRVDGVVCLVPTGQVEVLEVDNETRIGCELKVERSTRVVVAKSDIV